MLWSNPHKTRYDEQPEEYLSTLGEGIERLIRGLSQDMESIGAHVQSHYKDRFFNMDGNVRRLKPLSYEEAVNAMDSLIMLVKAKAFEGGMVQAVSGETQKLLFDLALVKDSALGTTTHINRLVG